MNPGSIIGEEERAHPDHCQKGTDGAKNGLGRCHTGGLLRKIHSIDGRIQRGEDTIWTFLSFGIRIHGFRVSYQGSVRGVGVLHCGCHRVRLRVGGCATDCLGVGVGRGITRWRSRYFRQSQIGILSFGILNIIRIAAGSTYRGQRRTSLLRRVAIPRVSGGWCVELVGGCGDRAL